MSANARRKAEPSYERWHRPAQPRSEQYMRRTSRNHFWVGGLPGQETLRNLKVAVAGLGGMGSHVAELLARLGVGELRLSDPDTIDVSNLNRQVIANQDTVGHSKTEASMTELGRIAPDLELWGYPGGVEQAMIEDFLEGCDVVVDEIDVFPLAAHRVLHHEARRRNLPVYSAYVVGMGVHFYKFSGESKAYSFDDFLGPDPKLWEKPSAEFLAAKFGQPLPGYLQEKEALSDLLQCVGRGQIPIFGPSTLLGQSLVAIRLVMDLLRERGQLPRALQKTLLTPEMPDFLVLDPVDMSFRKARVPKT